MLRTKKRRRSWYWTQPSSPPPPPLCAARDRVLCKVRSAAVVRAFHGFNGIQSSPHCSSLFKELAVKMDLAAQIAVVSAHRQEEENFRSRHCSTNSGFALLPPEIFHAILDFACRLPARDEAPSSSKQQQHEALSLDVCTTLTLTLVSREVFAFVAPILYDHVVISRPSTLRAFNRTMQLRPALGRLVRSLWVGSRTQLSGDWWPFRHSGDAQRIVSSIKDTSLLPPGAFLGQEWPISSWYPSVLMEENAALLNTHRVAVTEEDTERILRARIEYLLTALSWQIGHDGTGVHPTSVGSSRVRWIGEDEWTLRILELQGRLDAVLLQLRADGGQWRPLNYYLSLPARDPHSRTDHFDHPLLYARSGATGLHRPTSSIAAEDIGRDEGGDRAEDFADLYNVGAPEGRRLVYNTYSDSTMGGVLSTTRSLLATLPLLQHFGCSGYLERAVAGWRGGCDLRKLQTLSLGPPPPYWSCPLSLDQRGIDSVETLLIAGCMLFTEEAECVAGKGGALPHLRKFKWTLWASHTPSHPLDLIKTIQLVLSVPPTSKRTRQATIYAHLDAQDVANFKERASEDLKADPRLKMQVVSGGAGDDSTAPPAAMVLDGFAAAFDVWEQEVVLARRRAGEAV